MKKEFDHALYVHCKKVKKCRPHSKCSHLVFELGKLIKFSPKRSTLFSTLNKQLGFNSDKNATGRSLRTLCPTRWTVRHTAIESVLLNYDPLKATLDEVEKGHDEYAAKDHGMLIQ